jgi:hypothetical protein
MRSRICVEGQAVIRVGIGHAFPDQASYVVAPVEDLAAALGCDHAECEIAASELLRRRHSFEEILIVDATEATGIVHSHRVDAVQRNQSFPQAD